LEHLLGLFWSPKLAQLQHPFRELFGLIWDPKLTHFQDPFWNNFWA
jgi:hypothetical protein